MSARFQIGQERYVIQDGEVTPEDASDVLHTARARYFTTSAPLWLDQARQRHEIDLYDPHRDCTLAQIIVQHVRGRFDCDPPPTPKPGTVF